MLHVLVKEAPALQVSFRFLVYEAEKQGTDTEIPGAVVTVPVVTVTMPAATTLQGTTTVSGMSPFLLYKLLLILNQALQP